MPPPRPPSKIDLITFPVFACAWHGSPSLPPTLTGGCTVLAYCGGGGSARTGVGNSIVVTSAVQAEPGEGGVVRNEVKLDTGEQIGVGVAIHRGHESGLVRLAAAVGDEVRVYSVPLSPTQGEDGDEGGEGGETTNVSDRLLLGSVTTGPKYGCNAVAWSPLGDEIAVGCENGRVLVYTVLTSLTSSKIQLQPTLDLPGHEKAVSSVSFHPRGGAVLSSGKDGTARLYDASDGKGAGTELAVMRCSIEHPDPAKAAKIKAALPKRQQGPQQVLVRGCAFGDLQGKTIYTVASGKRGAAYLAKWRVVPKPNDQAASTEGPVVTVTEEVRTDCSPVPVSAVSISGDASHLALGGVDGTVTYLDLTTPKFKPTKKWVEIHDLPVTCIAARPAPLPLPGDEEEGVSVDVMSASADNRLSKLTLQRRSRKKRAAGGGGGSSGGGEGVLFSSSWSFLLVQMWLIIVAVFLGWISWEECRMEISAWDVGAAKECVWHTVLWAPADRPGVAFPPPH